MKHLKELITNVIITGLILFVASNYFSEFGFTLSSTEYNIVLTYLIMGFIFRILNTIVRKILKIITLPLKYLTLGLSILLINVLIFYGFQFVLQTIEIGIIIKLGGIINTLIISTIITLTYFLIKKII